MTVAIEKSLPPPRPNVRVRPFPLIWAFIRRDWLTSISYRVPFFISLGQSLITVVFLYFLARVVGPHLSLEDTGLHGGYFAFSILGTTLLAIFSVSLTSVALRLRTDQTTGTLEVLFTMPPRPAYTVLASASYQIVFALGTAVLSILFAVILGLRFYTSVLGVLVMLCSLIGSLVLFCAAGVFFAAFVIVFKRGETLTAAGTSALSLLGGVYFPLSVMPTFLRDFANILPFTWALAVLRDSLLGNQLALARLGELWLSAVILMVLALWTFDASLRWAQRRGTLGQY